MSPVEIVSMRGISGVELLSRRGSESGPIASVSCPTEVLTSHHAEEPSISTQFVWLSAGVFVPDELDSESDCASCAIALSGRGVLSFSAGIAAGAELGTTAGVVVESLLFFSSSARFAASSFACLSSSAFSSNSLRRFSR
jgi:hypothetical protein